MQLTSFGIFSIDDCLAWLNLNPAKRSIFCLFFEEDSISVSNIINQIAPTVILERRKETLWNREKYKTQMNLWDDLLQSQTFSPAREVAS